MVLRENDPALCARVLPEAVKEGGAEWSVVVCVCVVIRWQSPPETELEPAKGNSDVKR